MGEKKIRVLLADDEPELRDNIRFCLQESGCEVITAQNGIEGLELFRKERPDVIISDILMPEKNGMEFLEAVAKEEQDFCFILITGHGEKQMAIKSVELGAYRFIEKPFEMEELFQAVSRGAEFLWLKKRNKELAGYLQMAYEILSELNNVYFERIAEVEDAFFFTKSEHDLEESKSKIVQLIFKSSRIEKKLAAIKDEIKKRQA
ncbi:MAG: response regulator [Oligoflexia bacterium]|nr:response regulator [Oligoflexia bacterium]